MDDFNTSQCLISLMNLTKNTVRMMNEEVRVTSSRSPGAIAAVKTYVEGLLKSFGFQLDTALVSIHIFKSIIINTSLVQYKFISGNYITSFFFKSQIIYRVKIFIIVSVSKWRKRY